MLFDKIPNVSVKNGAVKVFGRGTPVVYINGRKVRDNAELDQLASDNINSVEVINNPGARYDKRRECNKNTLYFRFSVKLLPPCNRMANSMSISEKWVAGVLPPRLHCCHRNEKIKEEYFRRSKLKMKDLTIYFQIISVVSINYTDD